MKLGGEAGVSNPQMKNMKAFFRVMCIVMIPMTAQFPTAIFAYWITSNIFSLGQVSLLRVKSVRQYFGIPDMKVYHDLTPQGGFWENLKAGYTNAQDSAHVKHHEKMKRQKAKAIGTAPLEPTYEHNPRIKHNQQVFSSGNKRDKTDKFKNKPGPSM
ncbi:hypothetical protein QZH41_019640 [Actinostola sp. cb2023]|nr:hypothetical protein QZH41_019640 [Actinostola sp. cb2023]